MCAKINESFVSLLCAGFAEIWLAEKHHCYSEKCYPIPYQGKHGGMCTFQRIRRLQDQLNTVPRFNPWKNAWLYKHQWITCQKNKQSTPMSSLRIKPTFSCEVIHASMVIGRAVVSHAWAAHAFCAGIRYRHCIGLTIAAVIILEGVFSLLSID